jgi:hypothetical protein
VDALGAADRLWDSFGGDEEEGAETAGPAGVNGGMSEMKAPPPSPSVLGEALEKVRTNRPGEVTIEQAEAIVARYVLLTREAELGEGDEKLKATLADAASGLLERLSLLQQAWERLRP